jgi:thiamine biosynthesis protein ThiS
VSAGLITIRANGEDHEAREGVSLAEFLSERGLALSRVVVERNGEALSPAEARGVFLADKDRLEIVRIVAGG